MRKLESLRKKYFRQALFVLTIAVLSVGAAVFCFSDIRIGILVFLAALVISYVMVKALYNDLQVQCEALFLEKEKAHFKDFKFDFGLGIDEKDLLNLEVMPAYQIKECHNVLKFNGGIIEEDRFYVKGSAKFLALEQTLFDGVVAVFNAPYATDSYKGEVKIENNKPFFWGETKKFLLQNRRDEALVKLLELFKCKEAMIATKKGKLYVFMKTHTKIFYQFSLFNPVSHPEFMGRLYRLEEVIKQLMTALKY